MRDVELRRLQGEDVRELMPQHPAPVIRLLRLIRTGEGDHDPGRRSNRLYPREPNHPRAEPRMGRLPFRVAVDFELRPLLRLEAELLRQLGISPFEMVGHRLPQQLLCGIDADDEVFRRDRVVGLEDADDLPHVAGADMEGVSCEGFVENLLGLFDLAGPHAEHSELGTRRGELRHDLDGFAVADFGLLVLAM